MARIPYITYREEKDGELMYYILQKEFPHNIGQIAVLPIIDSLVVSPIAGYNLWVVWVGTLRGNFVAVYPKHEIDLQFIFNNMANFYLSERIHKNLNRYEKFKIK